MIEQGVTISGKPLKDHLEALEHYDAIRYVREVAREQIRLTEADIRNLHELAMLRSRPEIAGQYATLARYVRTETGRHKFPVPAEVPADHRSVDIHPFNDGNGPVAWLLMNLILIQAGYPPAARPEDRVEYIRALQEAQAGKGEKRFNELLYRRLDATLDDYLRELGVSS